MIRMSGQLVLHLIHKSFDDDIHIRIEGGKHTYRDLLRAAQSYWGIEPEDYVLMGEDGEPREELDEPLTREETLYLVERSEAVALKKGLGTGEGGSEVPVAASETRTGGVPEFLIPLKRLELPDGTELKGGAISYSSGKLLIHSDDFGIASSPDRVRAELRRDEVILNISGIFIRVAASAFPPDLLLGLQEAGLLTSIKASEYNDPNLLLRTLIEELGEDQWR